MEFVRAPKIYSDAAFQNACDLGTTSGYIEPSKNIIELQSAK